MNGLITRIIVKDLANGFVRKSFPFSGLNGIWQIGLIQAASKAGAKHQVSIRIDGFMGIFRYSYSRFVISANRQLRYSMLSFCEIVTLYIQHHRDVTVMLDAPFFAADFAPTLHRQKNTIAEVITFCKFLNDVTEI